MSYQQVSPILTSANFESATWHDCPIYAFSIEYETFDFVIDLDFIVDWIPPGEQGLPYRHHISPATLVFHSASDVSIEIRSTSEPLHVNEITRTDPQLTPNARHIKYTWIIDSHNGQITLRSIGFTQYLRVAPALSHKQRLELTERGGVSFSRATFDGQ
jgi:hypothetical protein